MHLPVPTLAASAFAFGLLFGSFAGVLVARVPAGERTAVGRSRCDACGATLGPRDLVPVVSWLVLRGRCRMCGAPVPARWTLLELASGALFAVAALVAPDVLTAILLGPFLGVLLALTVIDLEHYRLPDRIVLPSLACAAAWIAAAQALGADLDVLRGLIGGAVFGGLLLLIAIASRGGMGLGDVKLAALIGLVVGAVDLASVGVAAGAAVVLGGLVAIGALLRGADRKSAVPFGPMLAAGALVAVTAGPSIADAYLGLFT